MANIYENIIDLAGATPFRDAYVAEQQRQLQNESTLLDQQLRTLQLQSKAMEIEDYIANRPVRQAEREKTLQDLTVSMDTAQREYIAQQFGQVHDQETYDMAKGTVQKAFPDLNLKMFGFGDKYDKKSSDSIDTLFSSALHDMPTSRAEHLQSLKDIAAMNRSKGERGTWSLKNVYDPKTNEWHTGAFHSGTAQLRVQDSRGNWKDVDKGGMLYASFQEGLPGVPSTSNLKQVMPAIMQNDTLGELEPKDKMQVAQYIASRSQELLRKRQAVNIIDAQQQAIDEAVQQYTTKEPGWIGSLFQGAGYPVPEILKNTKFTGKGNFPGAPEVGTVEDGFKYIGGDPSDRNNWEEQ